MRVFDSHFHIIDPRFPLVANNGFVPAIFTTDDYQVAVREIGVVGGVIVAGSFQELDQSFLREALSRLGPAFVGVTQLSPEATDSEILDLDSIGVRGVRFNLRRGGPDAVAGMVEMACRVYDLAGWHSEVYVNGADLEDLEDTLMSMPVVVIDHLGLRAAGYDAVVRLAEGGVRVKASGFGRLNFDPRPLLSSIAAASPSALMFGTDLPSTRAERPFELADVECIREVLDSGDFSLAMYGNAVALYRPQDRGPKTV